MSRRGMSLIDELVKTGLFRSTEEVPELRLRNGVVEGMPEEEVSPGSVEDETPVAEDEVVAQDFSEIAEHLLPFMKAAMERLHNMERVAAEQLHEISSMREMFVSLVQTLEGEHDGAV